MKTTKEPKVKVGKDQTLVTLVDGSTKLIGLDQKIGGKAIKSCVVGKDVSELYIAKELVPRMIPRGLITRAK